MAYDQISRMAAISMVAAMATVMPFRMMPELDGYGSRRGNRHMFMNDVDPDIKATSSDLLAKSHGRKSKRSKRRNQHKDSQP